ncbi:MAG: response regulator transcription factor [Planctomycetes bacterium]|nr:response regulator transcription factor [Planctomycetota bacterium]
MTYSILLADDHTIFRDGLKALIEKQKDLKVIAQASNGKQAIQLANQFIPDLAIIDISMPDLNGFEATKAILKKIPKIKIIALSMHSHRHFVVEMFKAGASAYLLKDCAIDELTKAIRLVMKGQFYISPAIKTITHRDLFRSLTNTGTPTRDTLTTRQREILQLLAEGKSTKQIAAACHISAKTVETHRAHIMKKLNIDNLSDLTKYALRVGITSL